MYIDVYKALYIDERSKNDSKIDYKTINDAFVKWCNMINIPSKFVNDYLSFYGMNEEHFVNIITSEQVSPISSSYIEWYNEFLKLVDYTYDDKKIDDIEIFLDDKLKNHTFFNFTKPFLLWSNKIIEEKLKETGCYYNNITKKAIFENCFNIVITSSLKVLIVELKKFESNYSIESHKSHEVIYNDFVENLNNKTIFLSLLTNYPVMTRTIITQCKKSISYFIEVLSRLTIDYEVLQENFSISGELIRIDNNIGDTHCGKKTVLILTFEKGKIVYKPRSMDVDTNFNAVVQYLNKKNIKYYIKVPKIIKRNEYGWQEYIDYNSSESEEDIKEIYYKIGVYSVLFYIFSASDMHFENIIINKKDPYFIDLESLFQGYQGVNINQTSSYEKIIHDIRNSVLSTCLFPAHIREENTCDISGISGHGGQLIPKGKYEIKNNYSSNMMLVRTTYVMDDKKNIPMINNKYVEPREYKEYVIKGFKDVYDIIMKNKHDFISDDGFLKTFENSKIRTIIRNTKNYSLFLKASTDPKYLKNAVDQNKLFDKLWGILNDDSRLMKIIPSEIEDLKAGDIPYFSTTVFSHDIIDSKGKVYSEFFNESIADFVNKRICQMTNSEKENQISYIRIALSKPIKRWDFKNNKINYYKINLKPYIRESLLLEAKKIQKKLIDYAYYCELSQDINWVDISISGSSQWSVHPMDNSVYDGVIGVGIFFVAMYYVTGDNHYLNFVTKIINASELYNEKYKDEKSLSAFTSEASLAYGYYFIGLIINDISLKNKAIKHIKNCKVYIETDNIYDSATRSYMKSVSIA